MKLTDLPGGVLHRAALAGLLRETALADKRAQRTADARSPWHARDGWRMNATARRTLLFRFGETEHAVDVPSLPGAYRLTIDGRSVEARGELNARGLLRVELDGTRMDATVIAAAGRRHVFAKGRAWQLAAVDPLHHGGEGGGAEGGLLAPMPGKVIALVAAACRSLAALGMPPASAAATPATATPAGATPGRYRSQRPV